MASHVQISAIIESAFNLDSTSLAALHFQQHMAAAAVATLNACVNTGGRGVGGARCRHEGGGK